MAFAEGTGIDHSSQIVTQPSYLDYNPNFFATSPIPPRFGQSRQTPDEVLAVSVGAKEETALNPTGHNVVQHAGRIKPRTARHRCGL
jgi:hypothetical protein